MKLKNALTIVTIILSLFICSTFLMCGCTDKNVEPVYTMKLFDDNWNKVEMIERDDGDYQLYYKVKYDGTPKGLNAVCYKDGQEIYRYKYKNGFVKNNMVAVWSQFNGVGGWGITEFPTMPGASRITYTFDRDTAKIFKTPVGDINHVELPKTMYRVDMSIYI